MKHTLRLVGFVLFAVLFVGCASWFQARVEMKDAKIEALEEERKAAPTDEERARIDEKIVEEKVDRDASLKGALEEQKNKQAFLMALITLGAGGLKFAADVAAKGAI